MLKKVNKILFIWFFLLSTTVFFAFADGQKPPSSTGKSGNFSKKTFSNKNAWSTNGKGELLPPDPGGGGTGGEINSPIPNGISILILGSFLFFGLRIYNEEKKRKNIPNKPMM